MIEALKESFVTGVGIGLGIGTVLVVVRMASNFLQGLFYDKDDDEAEK